jgi:hypothetical protein
MICSMPPAYKNGKNDIRKGTKVTEANLMRETSFDLVEFYDKT